MVIAIEHELCQSRPRPNALQLRKDRYVRDALGLGMRPCIYMYVSCSVTYGENEQR